MRTRARWGALSVVLMLLWGPTRIVQACPHPCTCYVPSEVHCTFRSLAAVPAGISKHVERINLGFNSIQALSGTSFAGLTKLELLMIHGNDIPSIPDGAFRDLRSLQVLKFSYNKLRVITDKTLQGLENLVRLHVDHNKIEFLHPRALLGLTSLRLLHLEGNLLKQVHPGAFSTFSFLGYFQLSTVRHLYLGENALSSLPDGVLQNMPLLENVYLHGNPWTCTCDMRWFLHWGARDRGILKCKKDKAYEGGQLCAMCSGPQQLQRQEIQKLGDVTCVKPVIQSPLRQNGSRGSEEELEVEDEEEDADSQASLDRLQLPVWNVSLNMTDEHGNTVDLICGIKKPTHLYKVQLNQTEPLEVDINATVALDFECPMIREKYEKLWRLIAYYSEVPLKLHREPRLSNDPAVPYEYRQDSNDDDLYYTGVRARVLAEPEWVTQPSVHLQLDRRHSTARKVLLSYQAHFSQTVSAKDLGQARSRSWVLVEDSGVEQRSQMVLEGKSFQLSCNVRASQSPSIFWILPDGSVLRAPMEDPNSKFSVLSSGQLKVRSAEYLDSGLYQCIVQVPHESDRMLYRVSVQAPVTQPPGGDALTITKSPGESLNLPCSALAIPEPHLSWILPDKRIMNHVSNTSHVYMLDNGTLSIPKVRASDGGLYRCVAINLQGTDHFTVGVMVSQKGPGRNPKRSRRPGGRMSGDVVDDEGGSGVGSEAKAPRRILRPVGTDGFVQTKDEATSGGGKTRKGRRKLKLWNHPEKEPETRVAEGRRGFETRRKVNMAKKQINAEHWADILARVRGKNVPKGTEVPQSMQSTTLPSTPVKVLSLSPALPWPSVSPPETATIVEESSADMSTFKEEEPSLDSMFSTKVTLERDHQEVILAGPEVTSNHPEDVLEKTEDEASTDYDPSIPISIVWPSEASSAPQTFDTFSKEPMHEEGATQGWPTAPGFTSVSPVTSDMDELPLEAISVEASQTEASLYPDAETGSYLVQDKMEDLTSTDLTPTPTWGAVDPTMPESLGELHGAGQRHLKGETDKTQTPEGDLGAQDKPLTRKDMAENSQITKEGAILERDPNSEKKEGMGSVSPIGIGETSPTTLVDQTTTAAPTMTSKPNITPPTTPANLAPRRKSNGRKRLRPHRLRHRHKQTQPMTPEPTEMVSLPSAQASEVTSKDEGSLVMTSGADNTAGASKQLATGTPAQPITKGTSRRKHSRKQNRHRYTTSTGARDLLRPNEVSPPSSKKVNMSSSPKQELVKEAFDDDSPNTLPRGPAVHPHEGRGHISHQAGIIPPRPTPPRWIVKPPHMTTQSSSRHFVTFQPPRHVTNKPEITAFPSRIFPGSKVFVIPKSSTVTTPVPWHRPQTILPSKFDDHGASLFNTIPKVLGSNSLPEQRSPHKKPVDSRPPHHSHGRAPFFFNRTLVFPQLGGTMRPPTPSTPVSVTREKKVTSGPYNRMFPQSVIHIDFGPPAPPLSHPPRATVPPSNNRHIIPPFHPTRSSIPSTASPGQPSRNVHQSSSRIFSSVGGPPASKFWTPGEKPQIVTKSPKSVSVTVDMDAMFPCEATGKPPPFVTWTKVSTGALLTPSTRTQRFQVLRNGTLLIRNVQTQDHGQYVCSAKNLYGVDTMPVLLTVTTQQPQILASHYQDVTVYLGDTIAMECLAKGTPAPQISWIFPDRRVWHTVSPVEGRVTLHENRTLSIKEASFSDRGVYKCVASNAAGADSLAIRLHVAALPPVIQQEKQENISLPPGLSIHIHCTAKAAPLPSVRWVLGDGTQVRPSQFVRGNLFVFPNGTLYIRHLAPKDSGRYECVAANLVGSARRTVQLTVQRSAANARITATSPRKTDVRYGETLRLDCSASGDPWPRTQWRLPSQRMVDALFSFDPRVKVFPNGTLVVTAVTDKDSGDYLCVVRNDIGDDYVALKVNVMMQAARIKHKDENDHRVSYGSDLHVDCVATGLPDPEISWSLPDGSQVNPFMQSDDVGGGRAKRFVVFNNGTLYFNEVGMREAGDYTCVAQNQVGKDEMKVRVRVVAAPAEIRNKTYSVVQVPYGDVVTVSCHAKGDPTPRVTWLSPTNRLIPASSEKYQVSQDGTLLIRKAQRSDSGNYTCVVRNTAGEDRKAVWVQVRVQAPQINGSPNAITTVREVAEGGSRKLIDCRAEGIPAPRALWAFPEGVVLPAPYYGNRVTVHRNGTLDIRNLRPSDSVQLTCIARNEGGEARLIVQLTVLDPAEKPVFRDPVEERIIASAGHTISLNCSASGAPAPTLLWLLPNGTELPSGRRLRRFFHELDGRLHIAGLSPADAGPYRCVARNPSGHSERLVSLQVGLQPAAHNAMSVTHGSTLHLHCPLRAGRPAPVSWTLPNGLVLGVPQEVGRFVLWDNGTLTVHEASALDRGTYACKVDTAVANIPVIVIAYPPRITSEAAPVIYARTGSTVQLSCLAVGIPKPQVSWELPDGARLAAGTQPRTYRNKVLQPQGALTVQLASSRDVGFYECSVENAVGRDSKTTYVHVF
ncbi:matrix-remodeling-associated protein 5-like [Rhynchocyon petersi]